ncbi:hypothetical protein MKEN_00500800 [Mycena kentingensis (nom. inval.)]|nr:hypothetical protein MKEN_00500800 [Mycena kentingensis (nom. inval.)]
MSTAVATYSCRRCLHTVSRGARTTLVVSASTHSPTSISASTDAHSAYTSQAHSSPSQTGYSSTHASSPNTPLARGAPQRTPPPAPVHVTFVDWIPGICSLLGFLVINLIDKDRVRGDDSFGDARAVWRARLFLFLGFALMAGGLAGSVTVLVLKYIIPEHPDMFKYYGYANVSQNVALMLSVVILWMAQNAPSEYEYNLTL